MQLEGSQVSIEEACGAAQVSRSGYYRFLMNMRRDKPRRNCGTGFSEWR